MMSAGIGIGEQQQLFIGSHSRLLYLSKSVNLCKRTMTGLCHWSERKVFTSKADRLGNGARKPRVTKTSGSRYTGVCPMLHS